MDKKILELKNLVETADIALQQTRNILAELNGDETFVNTKTKSKDLKTASNEEGQIIEGIFDGEKMIGPDGKEYSVPANYASKSKLIEGDMLKLTILKNGSFIFKQIGPQERDRLKGKLIYDNETNGFRVMTENGKSYKLLTASVTYFKGQAGDETVVLVPKDGECTWAALENIIKEEDKIKADENRPNDDLKTNNIPAEKPDQDPTETETGNKTLEDISLPDNSNLDELGKI